MLSKLPPFIKDIIPGQTGEKIQRLWMVLLFFQTAKVLLLLKDFGSIYSIITKRDVQLEEINKLEKMVII